MQRTGYTGNAGPVDIQMDGQGRHLYSGGIKIIKYALHYFCQRLEKLC